MKLDELFASSLVSIAFGCGVEPEPGDFGPGELAADEAQEIVENLRQAGNPAAEIEVRGDGTVLLEGDAVVTLEASREMVGREGEDDLELRQYRTTNLLSPSVDTICIRVPTFTGCGARPAAASAARCRSTPAARPTRTSTCPRAPGTCARRPATAAAHGRVAYCN